MKGSSSHFIYTFMHTCSHRFIQLHYQCLYPYQTKLHFKSGTSPSWLQQADLWWGVVEEERGTKEVCLERSSCWRCAYMHSNCNFHVCLKLAQLGAVEWLDSGFRFHKWQANCEGRGYYINNRSLWLPRSGCKGVSNYHPLLNLEPLNEPYKVAARLHLLH